MNIKNCTKCGNLKEILHFNKDSSKKDGLRPSCKSCDSIKASIYRESTKGASKRASYNKIWSVENSHKKNVACLKRKAHKLLATPSWTDLEKVEALYKEAKILRETKGLDVEVDHIIPLVSKLVCGLHTEFNLRIISVNENRIKGNLAWPDCP